MIHTMKNRKSILLSLAVFSFSLITAQQKVMQTDFSKGTWEQVGKSLQRKWVSGSESTFALWKMDKGAHVPPHQHPNEQVTYITKGSVKVLMNNKEYVVKAGGVLIIPAGITHEFFCLEDGTEDLDFFTPVRKDWTDGTASYLQQQGNPLEVVAQFNDVRPGNVAVSREGRVFATIHPLASPKEQLVEIINGQPVPFPSAGLQKNGGKSADNKFDTPLGITVDKTNRLWMIDMGLELGKTRLWCIDLKKNKVTEKFELPADIAPKGSFVQDVAIDEKNGWAYLADIANPGIIALNLKTKKARRFSGHEALQSEDADMIIDGKVIDFGGKPSRVGINPITLSDDRETVFFGSMNGTSWYQVPAKLFRENADHTTISDAIKKFGEKPISDGAATDKYGNHYITNLGGHSISKLNSQGQLSEFVKDPKLKWPDNVAVSEDGYLYISVNQLDTTTAFSGEKDNGKPPYFIYRIKL
ncbi:quercetin dioxygenase-like cupin family protein [Chryseobacterium sp. 52]|uniref:L-dopachrome tautomerase-related protein n=1 Tax=Chryseobacterium sp. 52 TaxID=2035213 RepID=UPI000C498C91|nr:L-dopachrome tautomerase-related protein [Chryseobacterium sp. 52]PIF45537.1 quercetin dioxygenase-like cupin family protein [Chryseobacterium sp. 52]